MWRKSEVWKNKFFQVVAALQIVLLFWGILETCRGSRVIAGLGTAEISLQAGTFNEREGSCAIGEADGFQGRFLELSGILLKPGVYQIRLRAEAEDNEANSFGIECPGQTYRALLATDMPIYANRREYKNTFYVLDKVGDGEGLKVYVEYNGSGKLEVESLEIVRTAAGGRILILIVMVCSLLTDSLIMLYVYMGKYPVERERLLVWFGVPAVALTASLPLFFDAAVMGADSIYHWGRIEALAEGIRDGALPLRVGARWLYGHGYASSLFYADTFLTIPALLLLLGIPMYLVYNSHVLIVNFATAVLSYVSFKGIFKDRRLGMLGCMLFTLAPYRIYNIYNRSAVGEYTAMTFLPLLCLGFYLIFAGDVRSRQYRSYWLILVLGFSGIIQSHLLSCEMVGVFVILLCLLMVKKVFRRQTFVELAKAAVGTLALNLWFLLPCLDMMMSGEYYYSHNSNVYIQNRGILGANALDTVQSAGANSKFYEYGMQQAEPIGIGLAAIFGVIAFLYLRSRASAEQRRAPEDRGAIAAMILGGAGLALSSVYFPWDYIKSGLGPWGGIVSMLQFPTRLTIIPVICAVFVCCAAGMWAVKSGDRRVGYGFFGLICGVCILFSLYQTNDSLMHANSFFRIYSPDAIGHSAILGAEYLPAESGFPQGYHGAEGSEGVEVRSFEKKGLRTVTELSVAPQDGEYYVELPMLYYKGYQTRERFTVLSGPDGHVRVLLPAGYEGTLHVSYDGMWYWRLAEAISALTLLGLIVSCKNLKKY